MAGRIAARYVSRRLSSSGKVLGEEEKAAENIYIKRTEHEKLEKLAHKAPQPEAQQPIASTSGPVTDAKPKVPISSTDGVSVDKNRNYAVAAGLVTGLAAFGWYWKATAKKPEPEVQD
ncbi:hypothetical protein ACHQM5_021171 [Ranunculus cassubicifolius]